MAPRRRSPGKASAARRRRGAPTASSQPVELHITHVGGRGDGVATLDDQQIFVPWTGPGDRVLARPGPVRGGGRSAELLEILTSGGPRTVPFCPLFRHCGGCALQHLPDDLLADIKRNWIITALTRRGLQPTVRQTLVAPRASRRRATLQVQATSSGLRLGFNARYRHEVADMDGCPLLRAPINRALPALRRALSGMLAANQRAAIALTTIGEDLEAVIALPGTPDLEAREKLAEFAEAANLAGLWWRDSAAGADAPADPLALRRPFRIDIGAWSATLPPAPFMQASAQAETWLSGMADDAMPTRGRIADLFAGWGGFSLALLGRGERSLLAVDADAAATGALLDTRRRQGLDARLDVACRDLFRDPLAGPELSDLAGVVFDPPRAGARDQAAALAASMVPVVMGISCNPTTFARDARTLCDGGYSLEWVQPVDQFLYAGHVELAGLFRKK